MLLKFSDNVFRQIVGIVFYNFKGIIAFTVIAIMAVVQHDMDGIYHWTGLDLPIAPVTIVGGALAIFLGFRNNSAYDRWWEARKVWGSIVNTSRTLCSHVMTFPSVKHGHMDAAERRNWQRVVIRRQIAWLYALKFNLRGQSQWEEVSKYLSVRENEELLTKSNKPTHLLHHQNQSMAEAFELGMIDSFRHVELSKLIEHLYSWQGMAERIKKTVFPFYYNYFTKLFLWLFISCLPFALAPIMGVMAIPMSMGISFIFYILDKSGELTEDPFEARAADTPMSTISRSIEIDLLEMLGEEDICGTDSSLWRPGQRLPSMMAPCFIKFSENETPKHGT